MKVALVGTGSRARIFIEALATTYRDVGELVALCDTNMTRVAFYVDRYRDLGAPNELRRYHADDFEQMLGEVKPDLLIVSSPDHTHGSYIASALRRGIAVISEKPLASSIEALQQIVAAERETGTPLTVTFNYRYTPRNALVRKHVQDGDIGQVQLATLNWSLDTRHGADYFRRWHRNRRHSGGLLVHKACHHFDLIAWWAGAQVDEVYATGRLAFYGREAARRRGVDTDYERGSEAGRAERDPFALDLASDARLRALYLDAEQDDGYLRDQNVFGDGIDIEDTASASMRLDNGAVVSYALTAYSPHEMYRTALYGDGGSVRMDIVERTNVAPFPAQEARGSSGEKSAVDPTFGLSETAVPGQGSAILVQRHWEEEQRYELDPADEVGGHAGGDPRMLDVLFATAQRPDPLSQKAGLDAGVRAVLVGLAAEESIRTGLPVRIPDLLERIGAN